MRRILEVVLTVAATFFVATQANASVEDPRTQAIWDAAYNRMNSQADVWYDNGDFPRVVQLLRLEAELFPNDYETHTNLGWMLESIEEHPEALAVYINYRHSNPEDPDAAFPEAMFYFQKRAYAKVPPVLEPSIKKKPHANSFRILASAYERLNLLADARRVLKTYLGIDPGDATAKKNLDRVEKKIRGEVAMSPGTPPSR